MQSKSFGTTFTVSNTPLDLSNNLVCIKRPVFRGTDWADKCQTSESEGEFWLSVSSRLIYHCSIKNKILII